MMNRNNIHDGKGCLSAEQMLRYSSGKAGAPELEKISLHLQQCEFCADAVEGVAMLSPDVFALGVEELQQRTDQHTRTVNTRTLYPFTFKIAAAATILLFIGIGLFSLLKNETDDLQETAAVEQDTLELRFEEEISSLLSEQARNGAMGNMDRYKEVPPPPAVELEVLADMDIPREKQESASLQSAVIDIIEKEQPISINPDEFNKSEFNGRQRNFEQGPSAAPTVIDYFQQGLDSYYSGYYAEALDFFMLSEKEKPDHQKESRLFHTALSHIGLVKPELAIPLLQQVIEMKGEYREKAVEVLDSLE